MLNKPHPKEFSHSISDRNCQKSLVTFTILIEMPIVEIILIPITELRICLNTCSDDKHLLWKRARIKDQKYESL